MPGDQTGDEKLRAFLARPWSRPQLCQHRPKSDPQLTRSCPGHAHRACPDWDLGRATFVGTAFRKTSPQGRTSTQGLPAHGGVHSRARGKYPKTRVPSGRRSARNKCRSGRAERTNRISEPQPTRCAIATEVARRAALAAGRWRRQNAQPDPGDVGGGALVHGPGV